MGASLKTAATRDAVRDYGARLKGEIQTALGDLPTRKNPHMILFNHRRWHQCQRRQHYDKFGIEVNREIKSPPAQRHARLSTWRVYEWNPDIIFSHLHRHHARGFC
jgi:hypothetical protein